MRHAAPKKQANREARRSLVFLRALWYIWVFPAFLGSAFWLGHGLCQEGTPSTETAISPPTGSISVSRPARPSRSCDASMKLFEILQKTNTQLGDAQVRFPYSIEDRKDSRAELTPAPYLFAGEKDPENDPVLLKRMEAEAHITGPVARVDLHQVFQNIGARVIDADYVIPVAENTVVHGIVVRIGERVIETRMEGRAQDAPAHEPDEFIAGSASLIRKVWPDVLLMKVTHILPGDSIEVAMDYSQPMVRQNAVYEFTLPAAVGPREGKKPKSPRDQWIQDLYSRRREALSYDFDISVRLRTGIPIKTVSSPSHRISVFNDSRDSAQVHLDQDEGGNRDFVLKYKLAGDQIESGVLMYQGREENYIAVLMEPPERPSSFRIPLREFIFVVDVSGSMKGFPLDTAKMLMERLFLDLKASDYLNVVLFGGTSMVLNSQGSLNATEENIREAISLLDRPLGENGAELMNALRAAYGIPRPSKRVSRSLVVVTDGYVAVEAQMFNFIREHLDEAGLFVFGIGVSVNRTLMERMAHAGQAKPFVVISPDRGAVEAEKFRTYIKNPVLSEASVTFEGLDVYDQIPMKLPDLMAQRPLVVMGKYRGAPTGRIRISGFTGEERYVESLGASPFVVREENAPIAEIWAQKWVELLEDQYALLPHESTLRETVARLGLCHDLPTPFTVFSAFDSRMDETAGTFQAAVQEQPAPQSPSSSTPVDDVKAQSSPQRAEKPIAPEVAAIAGKIRQEARPTGAPPIAPDQEESTDEPARKFPAVTKAAFLFTPENLINPEALKEAVRNKVRPVIGQCASSPGTLKFRVEVDEYGTVIGATVVEGSGERDTDACIIKELPGMVTDSRPSGADYGSLEITLNISME